MPRLNLSTSHCHFVPDHRRTILETRSIHSSIVLLSFPHFQSSNSPSHLWASPPCRPRSLPWLCCCSGAPAPAGLAELQPAGRERNRSAPAAAGPAAERSPSLMSLSAPHSEPAEMTLAWWRIYSLTLVSWQGERVKCPKVKTKTYM